MTLDPISELLHASRPGAGEIEHGEAGQGLRGARKGIRKALFLVTSAFESDAAWQFQRLAPLLPALDRWLESGLFSTGWID
ncbi:hypothetical protein JQ609_21490 [Bradyrhizobium sp. AUGA SZCCT0169]|nr:hypothetical protein [Bradyrhizobium sp. AUGA SZCCT0169]